MKKISVATVMVLLVAVGWLVWSRQSSPQNTTIAIEDVQNVRFLGQSIQNEDGWRHATEFESKQIINWFNSAKYIKQADKQQVDNSASIIIELKPTEKEGDPVLERGEIIMIVNTSNEGFEVQKEENVTYLAEQEELKQFLNKLDNL